MAGHPAGRVAGPLAEIERARLVELRLGALEDRADAFLSLGDGEGLVGELAALATAHPFRERLAGLVLRALYQARRQADALAFYQRTRRLLVDELGMEPGPDLRRLHDDILNNRDDLLESNRAAEGGVPGIRNLGRAEGNQPAPRQLPLRPRHFVGRAAELAVLARLAQDAIGPMGTVVILTIGGGAEVGKTALAVHFGHQVVLSYPDGQLFADLRGFTAQACPVTPGEALDHLLLRLGTDPRLVPANTSDKAALYRTALAGRRVLIVLDTAASAEQVRPLLPGTAACLVIVTSRERLDCLMARDGAHRIALDVLPRKRPRPCSPAPLTAGRWPRNPARSRNWPSSADTCHWHCA